MAQLKRKYRLLVGKPKVETLITEYVTEDEVFGKLFIPQEKDYRTVTLNAVEITDVDISCSVSSKSSGAGNSNTVINLFNLSEETLQIVENTNNYVILEAGYSSDEELKVVFTGQVIDFATVNQGEDLVTTLTCGDGYIPNNSIRVDKSFPAGTSADTIFKFIIKQYKESGIPLGLYEPVITKSKRTNYVQLRSPSELVFQTGYSLNGYLSDCLKDLSASIGYVNYITNGRLFIHPEGYTKTIERFEVDVNSIYSIRPSGKNSTPSPNSKVEKGVVMSLPLDGRLDVDKQIKVNGGKYEGVYKIESRTFNINTFDGNFEVNLSCKQVEA